MVQSVSGAPQERRMSVLGASETVRERMNVWECFGSVWILSKAFVWFGGLGARWEYFGNVWVCLGTFWERMEASGNVRECFGTS